jgi:hypothetical protein
LRKILLVLTAIAACLALWGCSGPRQNLRPGTIYTEQIAANWPKFRESWLKFQEERSRIFSEYNRQRKNTGSFENRMNASGEQWQKVNELLKEEVREAVQSVAREKGLHLVIIASGVEYGGLDVSDEVLKSLLAKERQ